jgi:acyl carrier protein
MLLRTLGEFGLSEVDAAGITMDTMFYSDLEMESIDLVTLAGQLEERYGSALNFATFIAGFDLIEIIGLRVGQLVQYVISARNAPTADPAR